MTNFCEKRSQKYEGKNYRKLIRIHSDGRLLYPQYYLTRGEQTHRSPYASEIPQAASSDPLQWLDHQQSTRIYLADLNGQVENRLELIIGQIA